METDLVFEKYDVKKYLLIEGFVVRSGYTGIAEALLRANQEICLEKEITITATLFMPGAAIEIADKLEYTLEKKIV